MSAGSRYQPPINSAGTGPPGGGLWAVDDVDSFAEEVDWPHDDATRTKAIASRPDIATGPLRFSVVRKVRFSVAKKFPQKATPRQSICLNATD